MGQFGSLYDTIRNSNNDHTAWAAVNVRAGDNITGYGQVILADSAASFRGPALDPKQVSATPPGFDYLAVSDLGNYSRLDVRWWSLEAGLRQSMRSRLMMDYALTYQNYKDNMPYLADTTGRNWGFVVRASWVF